VSGLHFTGEADKLQPLNLFGGRHATRSQRRVNMAKFKHVSSGTVLPPGPNEEPNENSDETEDSGRCHDMNSRAFHPELFEVEDELMDFINQIKGKK
jgi:hypothetical protein